MATVMIVCQLKVQAAIGLCCYNENLSMLLTPTKPVSFPRCVRIRAE